jgi:hypothetical protein
MLVKTPFGAATDDKADFIEINIVISSASLVGIVSVICGIGNRAAASDVEQQIVYCETRAQTQVASKLTSPLMVSNSPCWIFDVGPGSNYHCTCRHLKSEPEGATWAQSMEGTVPVTVDNVIRAESDLYLSAVGLKEDGFGQFEHQDDGGRRRLYRILLRQHQQESGAHHAEPSSPRRRSIGRGITEESPSVGRRG